MSVGIAVPAHKACAVR